MTDKTKMIYNDDNTIGVDEQSLNKLMNILTPRMQKQLVDELHNNKSEAFMESEDSEENNISVDVSKTLEANKQLLEHPFYN